MRVAYLTNAIPAYRDGFFSRLLSDDRVKVTVFCQTKYAGHAFQLGAARASDRIVPVPTKHFFGGKLLFEKLPFCSLLKNFDVIVGDGNPRHAGFALASTLARLAGKRVVIWSTLHSRRNAPATQFLRTAWLRMFCEFLSYTQVDADLLRRRGIVRWARSANNGLDQDEIDRCRSLHSRADLETFAHHNGLAGREVLLSIGRAVPGRFEMMAEVLAELKRQARDVVWVLLGDGDGIPALTAALERHGVLNDAILAGAVFEEAKLARWFGIAKVFVYTDAIGLSLYHAFGYGLPVVAHDNLAVHGPEMGVFEDGLTGFTYRQSDVRDMAHQIVRLLDDDELRARIGERVSQIVREKYNARIMYERFVEAMISPPPKQLPMGGATRGL